MVFLQLGLTLKPEITCGTMSKKPSLSDIPIPCELGARGNCTRRLTLDSLVYRYSDSGLTDGPNAY